MFVHQRFPFHIWNTFHSDPFLRSLLTTVVFLMSYFSDYSTSRRVTVPHSKATFRHHLGRTTLQPAPHPHMLAATPGAPGLFSKVASDPDMTADFWADATPRAIDKTPRAPNDAATGPIEPFAVWVPDAAEVGTVAKPVSPNPRRAGGARMQGKRKALVGLTAEQAARVTAVASSKPITRVEPQRAVAEQPSREPEQSSCQSSGAEQPDELAELRRELESMRKLYDAERGISASLREEVKGLTAYSEQLREKCETLQTLVDRSGSSKPSAGAGWGRRADDDDDDEGDDDDDHSREELKPVCAASAPKAVEPPRAALAAGGGALAAGSGGSGGLAWHRPSGAGPTSPDGKSKSKGKGRSKGFGRGKKKGRASEADSGNGSERRSRASKGS